METREISRSLLDESDAERLEKVGFLTSTETVASGPMAGMIIYRYEDPASGHDWIVDHEIPTSISESIDAALLGILERMVWKKGWSIYHVDYHYQDEIPALVRTRSNSETMDLTIYADATEREEFEAFMQILEKE